VAAAALAGPAAAAPALDERAEEAGRDGAERPAADVAEPVATPAVVSEPAVVAGADVERGVVLPLAAARKRALRPKNRTPPQRRRRGSAYII
jgi:hypothetical protein